MSDEEIRIAIAEACGFKRDVLNKWKPGTWLKPDKDIPYGMPCGLPNYPHDLNAMAKAEHTLSNDEWDDKYYHWLGFVVSGGQTEQLWQYRKLIIGATARQRAEAFLRVKGLWKEAEGV